MKRFQFESGLEIDIPAGELNSDLVREIRRLERQETLLVATRQEVAKLQAQIERLTQVGGKLLTHNQVLEKEFATLQNHLKDRELHKSGREWASLDG